VVWVWCTKPNAARGSAVKRESVICGTRHTVRAQDPHEASRLKVLLRPDSQPIVLSRLPALPGEFLHTIGTLGLSQNAVSRSDQEHSLVFPTSPFLDNFRIADDPDTEHVRTEPLVPNTVESTLTSWSGIA
jgi:hypothetical protein